MVKTIFSRVMWLGGARVSTVGLAIVSVLGIFIAGCGPLEVGKGETPTGTKEEVPTGTKGETPTGTKGETPTGTSKSSNGGDVENGKIAFESYRDGGLDVWVMNAGGSEQTNLTDDDPAGDWGPVWSPDGAKIAFHSTRDSSDYEVHVMNADGSNPTNLSKNPRTTDEEPAWSPDSTKIAFQSDRDGNEEIYVMNALDGSEQSNLSKNPGDDEGPVWSPDGAKIAFERNRDIFVVDADGTETPANLTNDSKGNSKPSWSPDGTEIAFQNYRDSGGYGEIYTMDADGSNPTRLTNNRAVDSEPVFSPDGAQIAFESERDGASQVYAMNALDGSGQTNLSNDPESEEWGPVWSPDGAKIAFVRRDSNYREIYTMDADGSEKTALTYSSDGNDNPRWRPTGEMTIPRTPTGTCAPRTGQPRPEQSQISINSKTGWQQTPLSLEQGDRFEVRYSEGDWTVDCRNYPYAGPEGHPPDIDARIYQGCRLVESLPYGTLLGQVGNGSPFDVGEGDEFTADASGALYLRINDDDACLVDNDGELIVDEPERVTQSDPPTAPSNLSVVAVDSSSIRLEWVDNSDDEDGFEVSNGETETTVGAGVTTYTWRGLEPGTYMCFKVRSFNSEGNSEFAPADSPYYECATTPEAPGISITSEAGWQQTPLRLQRGDRFEVRYSEGEWTVDYRNFPYVGPEGYPSDVDRRIFQGCKVDDSLPYGTLLGKVGNGSPFPVREGGEFTADASGALSLRINDDDACLVDNAGELVVDQPERVQ